MCKKYSVAMVCRAPTQRFRTVHLCNAARRTHNVRLSCPRPFLQHFIKRVISCTAFGYARVAAWIARGGRPTPLEGSDILEVPNQLPLLCKPHEAEERAQAPKLSKRPGLRTIVLAALESCVPLPEFACLNLKPPSQQACAVPAEQVALAKAKCLKHTQLCGAVEQINAGITQEKAWRVARLAFTFRCLAFLADAAHVAAATYG